MTAGPANAARRWDVAGSEVGEVEEDIVVPKTQGREKSKRIGQVWM